MSEPGGRSWWPRASLRRDEDFDLERRVSWLELFFDLVFVVVLARLAHDLAHHPDRAHLLDFALLFAAVFWSWNAFTYYIERFESGGLEQRFFVFAAMATVAALGVWSENGLGEHYTGFAWSLVAVRLVNMMQWIRAGRQVPRFRAVSARFVIGFGLTAALLAVAGGLDGGARRAVFALAVLVDILTPVTTLRLQARLPRLSTSKFPERFGLFTILVLGETIVGVISGVSALEAGGTLGVAELADGALGLLVGIGLWWVYFDFVARRSPKPRLSMALGWVYLHLLTLGAIAASGAALSVTIGQNIGAGLDDDARFLLTGSVATALVGVALLETTLRRDADEPTHPIVSPAIKAAVAGSILLVGWTDLFGQDISGSGTGVLAALVVGLAIPAIYGATVWYSPTNAYGAIEESRTQ